MAYAVIEENEKQFLTPMSIVNDPKKLKALTSTLGWKIFQELSKAPSSPTDIAKKFKMHEQKIYYHINRMKKVNLIKLVRKEERRGATAKYYAAKSDVLGIIPDTELEKIPFKKQIEPDSLKFLGEFIKGGSLDATIVVGSPDPHGEYKARASDSCCAIDFALFLGSFTSDNNLPNYMLDTEIRNELDRNLILIGGPKTNIVTSKVNKYLPLQTSQQEGWVIVSKISGHIYPDDECGYIVKTNNPWHKDKKILVIAGNRFPGTRAAVLGFVKHLENVSAGNRYQSSVSAKVVKGIDKNGDGIVDEVEFLE